MSLSPGTRIGIYEVTAKIGEGGMGEVYQARDTTLDRDVALKVLPEAFTADPDRLARFRREAKVLASLNHPNIGAIYGLESSGGIQALVLELIDGPTLADRIAEGPIPVDDVLAIAKQIAGALEAAHEQGIIHRDLKPANVKVRPDGTVKVLDFGLAKAVTPVASGVSAAELPTMSMSAPTQMGMVLGTPPYMSPEQAKGMPVDKRADVWAFGCVVYEMLTGTRAFPGDDVSEILASILARDPDTSSLSPDVPRALRRLLRRCLEKDQKRRLRDLGDAMVDLEEAPDEPSIQVDTATPAAVRAWGWRSALVAVAALVLGAAIAAVAFLGVSPEESRAVVRFAVTPGLGEALDINAQDTDLAVSPDGTKIVYVGAVGGQRTLFIRSFDRIEATPLADLGTNPNTPFFSPDGEWVGFFDRAVSLKKAPTNGDRPVTIADMPGQGRARGASWGPDDTIIFATAGGGNGLWRVSANGGEPETVTTPDPERGESHLWPSILPDGTAVLFTITTGEIEDAQIAVLSLETGEQQVLVDGGSNPHYAPTGHLVYGADGVLQAIAFDPDDLTVTGDAIPVVQDVNTKGTGAVNFSVSQTGALVFIPGGPTSELMLAWVNRSGQMEPLREASGLNGWPRLSPDGRQVAMIMTGQGSSGGDVWLRDLSRALDSRLTVTGPNLYPVWTQDGTRVTFASLRDGRYRVFWKPVDASNTEELLLEGEGSFFPASWSVGDESLIYYMSPGLVDRDLGVMSGDGSTTPFLATEFNERAPRLSPDGRWVAYVSNQSGDDQVYVRTFPDSGQVIQVSTQGGTEPVWSRDGRELFYRNGGEMLVVDVESGGDEFGTPRLLFEGTYESDPNGIGAANYDVSLDGQQFLMVSRDSRAERLSLVVVENWSEELKERVPVP